MPCHTTRVEPHTVAAHLDDPGWVIVDCRHDLAQPEQGRTEYAAGHLPGARFAHLDIDLSARPTGGNGRHPLPDPDALRGTFGALGIDATRQVVAYDAHGGMFAARLWWLLKWMGHEAVAVLDGGWTQWLREGRPVERITPQATPAIFHGTPRPTIVDADTLLARLGDPQLCLVDARAPDRYSGEIETLDPVGGHIPGARNRFFRNNLDADGRFKPAATLRGEWLALLEGAAPGQVVHQCGSGVTACHNLLAMEIAGLPGSRLYPGSWSEWCADRSRPIARGTGHRGAGG